MVDRAVVKKEIIKWSEIYEWHCDDMVNRIFKGMLDDAIREAEESGQTGKQAIFMSLLVVQQMYISRLIEYLKIKKPIKTDGSIEIRLVPF